MAQLNMGSPNSVTSQVGMMTGALTELGRDWALLLKLPIWTIVKYSPLSALSTSTYRGGILHHLPESPLTKEAWQQDESSQVHK